MRRIFAFDPGTSALGWAVIETENGMWSIKGCGVRLHALARQRIVQTMKQRLKPEAREKLRQRRRARLRHLEKLVAAWGLVAPDERAPWQHQDGGTLRMWLARSLTQPLSKSELVRILFNIHRHRGSEKYGPANQPIRLYLAALLDFQGNWHFVLKDETMRQEIDAAIFYRREARQKRELITLGSPLATMAYAEFRTVWHALVEKYGLPDEVAIEAPLPAHRSSNHVKTPNSDVAQILELTAQSPTPRRLLRAKLFLQQADLQSGLATCALTGEEFGAATAFSARIEVDHLLPRAHGGKAGRRNLRLGLATANRTKGAGPGPVSMRAGGMDRRVSVTDTDALRHSVRLVSALLKECLSQSSVTMFAVGKITALRRQLFETLDSKNRSDLRHHAVDAILVAILAANAAQFDAPILEPSFLRARIECALHSFVFSSRAEHSFKGCKHEATRHGLRKQHKAGSSSMFITSRKPVDALTKPMLGKIADPALRQRAAGLDPEDSEAISQAFGRTRRVKIMQPGGDAIILRDANGGFLAAVLSADNHHMDIVQMRDGKWRAFAVSRHQRAQPGWRPQWEAMCLGGKLVMRLHKGDLVEWQSDTGAREVLIVARISGSSGILHFSRPFGEAGESGLIAAAAKTMQKRQARALHAKPAGEFSYRRSNCA